MHINQLCSVGTLCNYVSRSAIRVPVQSHMEVRFASQAFGIISLWKRCE